MTTQEKSKVIADRLVICYHDIELNINQDTTTTELLSATRKCKLCNMEDVKYLKMLKSLELGIVLRYPDPLENPDFFTPGGQKVLAKTLMEKDNILLVSSFNWWRAVRNKPMDLKLIASSSLAELFLEFIESEGK